MDIHQSGITKAKEGLKTLKNNLLSLISLKILVVSYQHQIKKINAAIIRDKGSNSEREMAYVMDLAGFNVKDIHMSDLISGRENLENIHFIVAVGGFSNSDVLGSAKGWAGSFIYNEKPKKS